MSKLKIFQDHKIRSHWDANKELWLNDLKHKLNQEGSEVSEKIGQFENVSA